MYNEFNGHLRVWKPGGAITKGNFTQMRMSHKFTAVAASFIICGGLCSPSSADVQSTKRAIQAVYDKISAAYSQKDTDTLLDTRTDDYTLLNPDGSVHQKGKDAERNRLLKVWTVSSSIEDHASVRKVVVSGKDVIVTLNDDYTRTQTNTQGDIGKVHEVGTVRAYLVNSPSGWQVKQERILSMTYTLTINGKVTKRKVYGKASE